MVLLFNVILLEPSPIIGFNNCILLVFVPPNNKLFSEDTELILFVFNPFEKILDIILLYNKNKFIMLFL